MSLNPVDVDEILEEIETEFGKENTTKRNNSRRTPMDTTLPRRKRSVYEFKIAQLEFKKNHKRYAQNLLDGRTLIPSIYNRKK